MAPWPAAEWKMSLLREGHRPDDPSLCGTVMVEEPWVEQSSTGSTHTTKTGVGPFGQSSATSGRRSVRSPALGAEVSVFPCLGDVALAMLSGRG